MAPLSNLTQIILGCPAGQALQLARGCIKRVELEALGRHQAVPGRLLACQGLPFAGMHFAACPGGHPVLESALHCQAVDSGITDWPQEAAAASIGVSMIYSYDN